MLKTVNNDFVSHKPFDLQEAVILLDVYLSFIKKGCIKTEAADIASERLRALAKKRGMMVSYSFRSSIGLQNRLRSIGNLFEGHESDSAPGTQVFREAIALYSNNRTEYNCLLKDAAVSDIVPSSFANEPGERKSEQMQEALMVSEQDFFSWLVSVVSPSVLEELKSTYKIINMMVVQKKALPQSLFLTTQIEQVENALLLVNKVFGSKKHRNNASNLFCFYIQYLAKKETAILSKTTLQINIGEDWILFDFSNAHEFERTVPAYCSIDGVELSGKNWSRILVGVAEQEIENKNPAIETLYKQSLLAAKKDRPFFLKDKINGLNCSKLSNGYWINVNYSIPRLLEQIRALCIHCGYSKSQIVIYGVPKGSNSLNPKKHTEQKACSHGVAIEKAEAFLKTADLHGASVQELIDAVQPGAAVSPTKTALDASDNVIEMPNDRYVHVDAFVDLDEAEEIMKDILQMHFVQFGGYSNNKLLFGAASRDLSMFLNDNDCEDIDSVYALSQFFFSKKNAGDKFVFSYPHIFERNPNYPLNLKGLMINLARANDGVLNVYEAKSFLAWKI